MHDLYDTVEALLAAKLNLVPELAGDFIYFLSDRSGRMSLYRMPRGGGVVELLLPADLALPNPKLVGSSVIAVLPDLGKILVSIDQDGDENYQPHFVPIDGGTPEPVWADRFPGRQVFFFADRTAERAMLIISPRDDPIFESYIADLRTTELTSLGSSQYGNFPIGHNDGYDRVAIVDGYTAGDNVLFLWDRAVGDRTLLAGVPLEDRNGKKVPLTGFTDGHVRDDGVLLSTTLFSDTGGVGWVPLSGGDPFAVTIAGTVHEGFGELTDVDHLAGDRYHLGYNIDGCSYGYEGVFDEASLTITVDRVLWGRGELADGVVEAASRDSTTGDWALAFSTATSPVQLYSLEGDAVIRHTDERIAGISPDELSRGEDASYVSHDGSRVSARLYVPSGSATPPFPVIHYIHGGPQSQERPDFTWFSMPLIQLFTLNGFAVFVPNVRGSTGYGQSFMKQVDRDWGGADRLDHVAALDVLGKDDRLDLDRLGVMGRSYGGFMTLTLLGRHPDLWSAGVDMFGPYDLFTFLDALPETWKTYMYLAMGHPDTDRDLLSDRSPRTHLDALEAPLLVIQGRNDPRVVVTESDALVDELRAKGKDIEYLVFDDEGHDMVKHSNKVKAYATIIDFFTRRLAR